MKIRLLEKSGHPYNDVRRGVEKMISAMSPDGYQFNINTALDMNKYETHYMGTINGKFATLIANTTHRALDDTDDNVFFAIQYDGQVIPIGTANAKDKDALGDLISAYFEEQTQISQEQKSKEDAARREQIEKKRQEDQVKDLAHQAEDEYRKEEAKEYLDQLNKEYKDLTGKDLPEGTDSLKAESLISQQKYVKDLPNKLNDLFNSDPNSTLTVSFHNGDHSKDGYLQVTKTDDTFKVEDRLFKQGDVYQALTKDQLKDFLLSPVQQDYVPNLISVSEPTGDDISNAIYS